MSNEKKEFPKGGVNLTPIKGGEPIIPAWIKRNNENIIKSIDLSAISGEAKEFRVDSNVDLTSIVFPKSIDEYNLSGKQIDN